MKLLSVEMKADFQYSQYITCIERLFSVKRELYLCLQQIRHILKITDFNDRL